MEKEKTLYEQAHGSNNMPVTRSYKDRIFRDLFGNPDDKETILSLYNAVNGSNYTNAEDIEVVTLNDAIYAGMKNDTAFVFQHELNLVEQQSSVNPNMPLRGFLYFADEYTRLYWKDNGPIYGRKLMRLKTPNFVVLYNGTDDCPDKFDLRLSDAFEKETDGYEWTAHVININFGKNEEMMKQCEKLAGYSKLIAIIRENKKGGMDMAEAVTRAVDQCIEDGILDEYLSNNRRCAISSLISEYDEAAVIAHQRSEAAEDAEDNAFDLVSKIVTGLKNGITDNEALAKRCGCSIERLESVRLKTKI